jgi:hypothetical protein
VADLPATSCPASSTIPPGTYPVTAAFSGDLDYQAATASTSFTITTFSAYTMTASADPAWTTVGALVTLTAAGLPTHATGTVTFTAAGGTVCVATLPTLHCAVPTDLAAGLYHVTATYSGDADNAGSSAHTRFALAIQPAVSGMYLTTHENVPVAGRLPAATGTGPFLYLLVRQAPGSTGRCSLTAGGQVAFSPSRGYVGATTCAFVVVGPHGLRSAPATVTILVVTTSGHTSGGPTPSPSPSGSGGSGTPAPGSTIPGAHTGEPWSGWSYWLLTAVVGISGWMLALAGWRRRRRSSED